MVLQFIRLMMMHALCDFSLQSDAMAKGKNRHNNPTYVPNGQTLMPCWYYWLGAHALISGGGVWIITGKWWWGIAEVLAHWTIDYCKCENWTNPRKDQFLHISCRLLYLF